MGNPANSPAPVPSFDCSVSIIIAILSLVGTIIAITVAAIIASRQKAHLSSIQTLTERIDQRLFGVFLSFEGIYGKIVKLLEEVASNEDSRETVRVSFLCYWLWFGADLVFDGDSIDVSRLDSNSSRISQLIWSRVSNNLQTDLVLYYPSNPKLKKFIKALLDYRAFSLGLPLPAANKKQIDLVLKNYITNLNDLRSHIKNGNKFKVNVKLERDIPALIYVMASDDENINITRNVGIYFLGETPVLKSFIKTGGFISEDDKMVKLLQNQILKKETIKSHF